MLDPDLQEIDRKWKASGIPGLYSAPTGAECRARAELVRREFYQIPEIEVGSIVNAAIPRPGGEIPIRVIRPKGGHRDGHGRLFPWRRLGRRQPRFPSRACRAHRQSDRFGRRQRRLSPGAGTPIPGSDRRRRNRDAMGARPYRRIRRRSEQARGRRRQRGRQSRRGRGGLLPRSRHQARRAIAALPRDRPDQARQRARVDVFRPGPRDAGPRSPRLPRPDAGPLRPRPRNPGRRRRTTSSMPTTWLMRSG